MAITSDSLGWSEFSSNVTAQHASIAPESELMEGKTLISDPHNSQCWQKYSQWPSSSKAHLSSLRLGWDFALLTLHLSDPSLVKLRPSWVILHSWELLIPALHPDPCPHSVWSPLTDLGNFLLPLFSKDFPFLQKIPVNSFPFTVPHPTSWLWIFTCPIYTKWISILASTARLHYSHLCMYLSFPNPKSHFWQSTVSQPTLTLTKHWPCAQSFSLYLILTVTLEYNTLFHISQTGSFLSHLYC